MTTEEISKSAVEALGDLINTSGARCILDVSCDALEKLVFSGAADKLIP